MEQHFEFKIKDQYLPKFINDYRKDGKIKSSPFRYYTIDIKYFRKLKLQNITNTISEEDKLFIEYLINDNFVQMLTEEESKTIMRNSTSGYSGSQGVSGVSGSYGTTGTSLPKGHGIFGVTF